MARKVLGLTAVDQTSLLRIVILGLISIVAVGSRLYSVIRFESVIHEFDPWFNYRTTRYLVNNGFDKFWNWFDETAWYPLGRVVGGTLYPGIMVTSATIYNALHFLNIPVDIRNVCVFLAPVFSALTAIATYHLTKEVKNATAGLLAAAFIGVAPGYISRSVAGSYDNEGIAIFLLVFTFFLWLRSVRLGSSLYAALTAVFYFYMVSAWGGYVFIINLIPLHVFALLAMGRYSNRLYVAYSTFYVLGTLASMQIPFVGFQPTFTSEHMAALGTFGLIQLVGFANFARTLVPQQHFQILLRGAIISLFAIGFGGLVLLTMSGTYLNFRSDKTKDTQASSTPATITDSSAEDADADAAVSAPAPAPAEPAPSQTKGGKKSKGSAKNAKKQPAEKAADSPAESGTVGPASSAAPAADSKTPKQAELSPAGKKLYAMFPKLVLMANFLYLLCMFQWHCSWVTSSAYSSPSVVLASRGPDGSQHIIDDFREAYYWLRKNTKPDAKVLSWWDYGYQLAGMADRTTLVDNNTWNNTHIATVGKIMASDEDTAYELARRHDVDYVLVVFGAMLGYSGDDINKFLWMIRIAQGVYPDDVKEESFFNAQGQYAIGDDASPAMKKSLMHKLSYYRFNDVMGRQGFDRVRNQKLPTEVTLDNFEEAYTSENWLVRIYKVKDLDNLGRDHHKVAGFEGHPDLGLPF
ncbi:oligosaccharyl transferase stt3 subunit [Dipsacomyces acuminosporus]|nr:oligosaccharyl transferase stt3 subunit [Dipsacomyces acuminosporus]